MKMGRSLSLVLFLLVAAKGKGESPLNVLWFVVDDMSANFSCYGEKTIKTPAVDRLAKDYEAISPFLDPAGRDAIAAQGTSIVAKDKSLETPLVEGKACAYATFDDQGWAHCGIEQAHQAGAVDWKKPISCHLYPVRVKDYSVFTAVNYHRWQICSSGCANGAQKQMPLYRFVAEALRQKFGSDWVAELDRVASEQNKKQ